MKILQKRQNGFSAMIVIVLIVLFSLLGTYMASMSTIGSLNTTQSVGSMQSWFAASSGVQWAIQKSLAASDGLCTCATNCCAGINGQTLNYSEGGLDGYSAAVSCSASPMTEAGSNYCVYNLGVTGTNGSSVQQMLTSRTISLSIADRNAP
jgi:Tfp pilus assembly protein PilX